MPRKVIDTAVIEYVPDLTAFGRTTDRELDRIFNGVERTARDSTRTIEATFEELQREIDDVFDDIARSGEVDMQRLGAVADRVATEVGMDFQHGNELAETSFRELRVAADRNLDAIRRDAAATSVATTASFNKMALVGSAALLGIGAAATAGLGALTFMGLSSAAQLEQVQISFNSLLGGVEEGTRVFKQLQDFAARTPFEFPEIADAAKRFLAFNESVGLTDAQLQQYLTTVGNVISVTGGGAEAFGRINLAIGQIGSASKITLENLNQIADAIPGFSPIAAIAKGLGTSTAEAMQLISAGAIPAAQGVQLLLQGMQQFPGAAGAMERQSQTLLGVFSTFKDVVGQTLAQSFAPVIPSIKSTLTEITPIIGDALGIIAPGLGTILTDLLSLVGGLVKGLAPVIGTILTFLHVAVEPLLPVLMQLVDVLGAALNSALIALMPAIEELVPALADILLALIPIIPPVTELVVALAPLLVLLVKAVAAFTSWAAVHALAPAIELLAKAVGALVTPIAEFTKWIDSINWSQVGDDIAGGFSDAWDAVSEFFDGVGDAIAGLPGEIGDFLKSLPKRVSELIGKVFDAAMQAIGIGIGLIIASFTELPQMIPGILERMRQVVVDFFTRTREDAKTQVSNLVDDVVRFVDELPGRLLNGLIAIGTTIGTFFRDAFNRAKEIASNAITSIVKFVNDLPSRIGGFALDVATRIVNFFKSILNRAIDGINAGIARVDEFIPGDLPRIPRLAHGGVAFGPAIIGENPGTTPEAAIPLGDPRALDMLRQALGGTGATVNFAPGSITVNVTGKVSADEAARIGKGIGDGIASTLAGRGIRTAVRTA